MQPEPRPMTMTSKLVISVLLVLPLVIVAGTSLCWTLESGFWRVPFYFMMMAVGGWYLYSLTVSLWLDHRTPWIVVGLTAGLLPLTLVTCASIHEANYSSYSGSAPTAFFETHGMATLGIAGTALTLYLLFRRLPSGRRPPRHRPPIIVQHSPEAEPLPNKGPYLPTAHDHEL